MNVWCPIVYKYISVSVSVPFRKYFGVVFSLGLLGCSLASPPVAAVVLKMLPSWLPLTIVKCPSVGVSHYSCQKQCQLLGLMSWVFLLPRLVCSHIWNGCYFCFFLLSFRSASHSNARPSFDIFHKMGLFSNHVSLFLHLSLSTHFMDLFVCSHLKQFLLLPLELTFIMVESFSFIVAWFYFNSYPLTFWSKYDTEKFESTVQLLSNMNTLCNKPPG